jgi:hypothetical protein
MGSKGDDQVKPAALAKRLGMTAQGRAKWALRFGMVKSGSDVTRADVVEHTVLRALRSAGIRDAELDRAFAIARGRALDHDGGSLDLVIADSGEVVVTDDPADLLSVVRKGGPLRVVDLSEAIDEADRIWQVDRESARLSSAPHLDSD